MTDGAAMIPEIEEAIACIAGVDAVRLIVDDAGAVAEIHIVGPPGRSAKRIVRDTESLLRARYGLAVDYRKISVVQLPRNARSYTRPRLADVSLLQEGLCVGVTLLGDGGEYRYQEPVGAASSLDAARAAAVATLQAASRATAVPLTLSLRETRVFQACDQDVMFVMVSAEGQGSREELTGTCIVGRCLPTAAAKATLDAINRRLELWSAFAHESPHTTRDATERV